MLKTKQVFSSWSLKSFAEEYYNMEDKIIGSQFEPVRVKQTCPSYSDGRDQDGAVTQHGILST